MVKQKWYNKLQVNQMNEWTNGTHGAWTEWLSSGHQ